MQGSKDHFQKTPKKNRRFDDGLAHSSSSKKNKSFQRRPAPPSVS